MRDAGVSTPLGHLRREGLQVGRSTAGVDVVRPSGSAPIAMTSAPARRSSDGANAAAAPWAQSTTTVRPGQRASHHAVRGPRPGHRGQQVVEVALGLGGGVSHPAEARGQVATPPGRHPQVRLDLVLDRVGQLEAAAPEELDPVVRCWIVARGQHHAQIRADVPGEEGDRGGGNHAEPQHVHTRPGQPGHHRCLEELPRGPRVAAHHRQRAAPGFFRRGEGSRVVQD